MAGNAPVASERTSGNEPRDRKRTEVDKYARAEDRPREGRVD